MLSEDLQDLIKLRDEIDNIISIEAEKLNRNNNDSLMIDRWNELVNSLDWDKIHNLMVNFNWEWIVGADKNGWKFGIPDIQHMKSTVRKMFFDVWKSVCNTKRDYCISTGGFRVSGEWYSEESYPLITVAFIFAECDV